MQTALAFGGKMVLLAGRSFDPDEAWQVVEMKRFNSSPGIRVEMRVETKVEA